VRQEPECLRWVVHRALAETPPPPAPDQWRAGLSALNASRLTPLAAHLLKHHLPQLPTDVRLPMEAAALLADAVAERSQHQLREAAAILIDLELPWLVLKSWPLAVRYYAVASCRPSGDLDLLVRAGDVTRVSRALEGRGYQPEPGDRDYHTRFLRPTASGTDIIELHHAPGPPAHGGIPPGELLANRVEWESPAGRVFLPGPEHELDLLIRHYLRHGGYQGILRLDLLLVGRRAAGSGRVDHPLGSIIGNDLERLGFRRLIDGPRRMKLTALRSWMMRRTFEERRTARHISRIGIPLALARSPLAAAAELGRVVWPARPTPRWVPVSRTGWGRLTWRLQRLARMGR